MSRRLAPEFSCSVRPPTPLNNGFPGLVLASESSDFFGSRPRSDCFGCVALFAGVREGPGLALGAAGGGCGRPRQVRGRIGADIGVLLPSAAGKRRSGIVDCGTERRHVGHDRLRRDLYADNDLDIDGLRQLVAFGSGQRYQERQEAVPMTNRENRQFCSIRRGHSGLWRRSASAHSLRLNRVS